MSTTRPPHEHHFDPVSGWCRCGYRDDGRLIGRDGTIYQPGPDYNPQQLDQLRQKARAR